MIDYASNHIINKLSSKSVTNNLMSYKELVTFSKARNERKMRDSEVGKVLPTFEKFKLDLNKAEITWTKDYDVNISAKCQIVGTRTINGQFMWAWGHPSVPEKSCIAAQKVQLFSNQQKLIELTERKVMIPLATAEDFSNITAFLDNADGTWVGDYGEGKVYIVYYEGVKVDKK